MQQWFSRIEDGTHRDVIAKVLDRDRTSINHYEVRHALNYASFPKYRNTFNLIYNAYSEIKDAKYTFKDMYDLKKIFKEIMTYLIAINIRQQSVLVAVSLELI